MQCPGVAAASTKLVIPGEVVVTGACEEVGPGICFDEDGTPRASVGGLLKVLSKGISWVDHSGRRVCLLLSPQWPKSVCCSFHNTLLGGMNE